MSMEGSSGTAHSSSAKKPPELETLQKQHAEKTRKIEQLKNQIESVKLHLEKKKKKKKSNKDIVIPDGKKENFKSLSAKYNNLREEYNALLAEKLSE